MRSQPRLGVISLSRDKNCLYKHGSPGWYWQFSYTNAPVRAGFRIANSDACVLWSNLTPKPGPARPGWFFSCKHGMKNISLSQDISRPDSYKQAANHKRAKESALEVTHKLSINVITTPEYPFVRTNENFYHLLQLPARHWIKPALSR